MKKKILILYTGGTIGMRHTENGFEPASGYLQQEVDLLPSLQRSDMPEFDIHEYTPLIDSADASPLLWNRIAQDISNYYEEYDGFLVLHGTDTMAFTAAALSFMLENLAKPVMLTGSQVPLCLTKTDARENLINALYLLQHYPVPEVTLYFNNCLFRGNRTTKINALSYDAFCSPNFSPLIKMATNVELKVPLDFSLPLQPLKITLIQPAKFAHLMLFPGVSVEYVEALQGLSLQALIIKSYGIGNAPSHNKALLKALHNLHEQGVMLVSSSQCLAVDVDMLHYATGKVLVECGAISAGDMTNEAQLAKLYYLFSQNLNMEALRIQFTQNLRGELTNKSVTSV